MRTSTFLLLSLIALAPRSSAEGEERADASWWSLQKVQRPSHLANFVACDCFQRAVTNPVAKHNNRRWKVVIVALKKRKT